MGGKKYSMTPLSQAKTVDAEVWRLIAVEGEVTLRVAGKKDGDSRTEKKPRRKRHARHKENWGTTGGEQKINAMAKWHAEKVSGKARKKKKK